MATNSRSKAMTQHWAGQTIVAWSFCERLRHARRRVTLLLTRAGLGLLAACYFTGLAHADPITERAPLPSQVSVVELPVVVDLTRVFNLLEQRLPRRAGVVNRWQKFQDLEVKYAIQRGPIQAGMSGERLRVTIPLAYWVRAQKSLAKIFDVEGSCGVDEPPRLVFVHLETALYWGQDWNLLSDTRVYPNYFVNPCLMTIANFDVTPLIDRELDRQLIRMARESIDASVPAITSVKSMAQKAWSAMQAPIKLDENIWLLLDPETVHVRPLSGKGTRLTTGVGVTARPTLALGPAPAVAERPLPPLQVSGANTGGIHLTMQATMRYADIRSQLETRLSRVLRDYGGGDVRLERVDVATEDQSLVVTLETAEPLAITVRMTGKPGYDPTRSEVFLADFDLQVTSDDPVSQLVDAWLRRNLRGDLQQHTAWAISGPLATVISRLEQDLSRRLPGNVSIDIRITGVRFPRLHSTPDHLTLFAALDATAQLNIGN
jgi:hypothetical protein